MAADISQDAYKLAGELDDIADRMPGQIELEDQDRLREIATELRGLTHPARTVLVDDNTECGRLLLGQGGDTWDPLCVLPKGHGGSCEPDA